MIKWTEILAVGWRNAVGFRAGGGEVTGVGEGVMEEGNMIKWLPGEQEGQAGMDVDTVLTM
jgi:hypothetical protein